MLPKAHARFRQALEDAGWQIEQDQPVYGGPNPSQFRMRKGQIRRGMYVYAWKITPEGKGRKKKGRDDLDFRVQTTRAHEGDLQAPRGLLTVGIGWHEELGVFGSFDVWVKRTTGVSSSVHMTRDLLQQAAAEGWAEHLRKDGPTCAWRPEHVDRFLQWLLDRERERLQPVEPLEYEILDDRLRLRIDPRRRWEYLALRDDDYVVLRATGGLLDDSVWRVVGVSTDRQKTEGGGNRAYLDLDCVRHGVVLDEAALNLEA